MAFGWRTPAASGSASRLHPEAIRSLPRTVARFVIGANCCEHFQLKQPLQVKKTELHFVEEIESTKRNCGDCFGSGRFDRLKALCCMSCPGESLCDGRFDWVTQAGLNCSVHSFQNLLQRRRPLHCPLRPAH